MNLTLNMNKVLDAVIDSDICVNCDKCGSVCPVEAVEEREKNISGLVFASPERVLPSSAGCPLGIVPQVIAEYVKAGRIEDAGMYLYGKNPLAAVCAQVCRQYCMRSDRRSMMNHAPVNIAALERYVVDKVECPQAAFKERYPEKVAIIGGGPSGIGAAWKLASQGYRTTIFEADTNLGGTMAWGIPGFRLDKDMLDSEIGRIVSAGIGVKTGVVVGRDVSLEDLQNEYAAVIIAAGASRGMVPELEGADGDMVVDGVSVLRAVNLEPENEFTAVGDSVVVIGGGRFAADLSRTLVRKGKKVSCVAMESEDNLQITREYLRRMAAEGIEFMASAVPVKIEKTEDGSVRAVEFRKVEMAADSEGMKRPVVSEYEGFTEACDTVVFAVGRQFDVTTIGDFRISDDGSISTDGLGMTSMDMVFACGDIAGKSNTAVSALASGMRIGENVDAVFRGRRFPQRRGRVASGSSIEVGSDEISMVKPAREEIIFSRSGRIKAEPSEDIVKILRDAGIEDKMPVLADRESEEYSARKKVAVIGGGVAGISAAIELAKLGYAPSIFEKTPYLGGKYRWLATDKRIDSELLESEMKKLSQSGIDVHCCCSAGIKPSISELKAEGYEAILFATGETKGIRPNLPNIYARGVFELVSLLSRLKRNLLINGLQGSVIVTGSDDMAVDASRKLKEYVKDVTLICRCSKDELMNRCPAVLDAIEEGVNLVTGTELAGVREKDGKVAAVNLNIIAKDIVIDIPCDILVTGDTAYADTATIIARNPALKADDRGHLITGEGMATPIKGVLSIGNVNLPSAGAGRLGAQAVDSYFTGEPFAGIPEAETTEDVPAHEIIEGRKIADKGFEVGRRLLSGAQARQEAGRFISSGYHQINNDRCIGCGICAEHCPESAIELVPCREVK